jgi:hypothetical protein
MRTWGEFDKSDSIDTLKTNEILNKNVEILFLWIGQKDFLRHYPVHNLPSRKLKRTNVNLILTVNISPA